MRIGLAGIDSSHAEDFIRHCNREHRFHDASVTALWCHDGNAMRASELARIDPSIDVAESLEALAGQVDCVIVGCRDGRLHRAHALTAIAAGCAVFVDKPLATTEADAREIVAAAGRRGVPLGSASALRWQHDTWAFKHRLARLDRLDKLAASGTWYPDNPYGGAIYYAIHTVELVQSLLGTDWRDVRRASSTSIACTIGGVPVTLTFAQPDEEGSDFTVAVTANDAVLSQRINLPADYMAPVAEQMVRMVRTGTAPLSADELLAPVRMMEAIEAVLA